MNSTVKIDPHTGRIIEVDQFGNSFIKTIESHRQTHLTGTVDNFLNDYNDNQIPADDNKVAQVNKDLSDGATYISKRKICLSRFDKEVKRTKLPNGYASEDLVDSLPSKCSAPTLKDWENPVVGVSNTAALELRLDNALRQHAKKLFAINNSFTFSKNCLEKLDVIGQVDKKFIACVTHLRQRLKVKSFSSDLQQESDKRFCSVLILFDQHAVHERIRLERLQYQFLMGVDLPSASERQFIARAKSIPSSLLNPVIKIEKENPILNIKALREHLDDFNELGISLNLRSVSEDKICIVVKSLPRLFVKTRTENPLHKRCYLEPEALYELILDHLNFLETKSTYCPRIPTAIGKVLNSIACHGAIRFGDTLTKDEMESLLGQLKGCDLPFQCAHGRPSVVPLFNLSLVNDMTQEVDERPRLWKITSSANHCKGQRT